MAVPHLERSTGLGPVAAPPFGRLLGAVEEDLVPVDAVQLLVALGQLLPGGAEAVVRQPDLEPLPEGAAAGEARRDVLPADAGDQDVEQSVQTFVVTGRRPPLAAPDDGGQQRFEGRPDFLGQPTRDGVQFHGRSLRDSCRLS